MRQDCVQTTWKHDYTSMLRHLKVPAITTLNLFARNIEDKFHVFVTPQLLKCVWPDNIVESGVQCCVILAEGERLDENMDPAKERKCAFLREQDVELGPILDVRIADLILFYAEIEFDHFQNVVSRYLLHFRDEILVRIVRWLQNYS